MSSQRVHVEWGNLALVCAVYIAWLAALALDSVLPWPASAIVIGVAIAWHGSLQHELLHGHPFSSQAVNNVLAHPPLAIRLPFLVYRREHLIHHDTPFLTDPEADPESFYVSAETWTRLGVLGRGIARFHNTLLGRLLVGPPVVFVRFGLSQWREVRSGDREAVRCWLCHVPSVAAVLLVALSVFGVRWWVYAIAVYIGHSLTLVRSFLEHRWIEDDATRCAMVRSGPVFSLLFLNNNLHDAHHVRPDVPWYRLPAVADELGSDDRSMAGAGFHSGYASVLRRYAITPFDEPLHPLER